MVEEEIIGEGRGALTCAELFSLCECWLVFVVSLAWKNGGEVGEGLWLSEEPDSPSTIAVPRW